MNVRHTIIYTFTVSSQELRLLRRGLKALDNPEADKLSLDLETQVQKSSEVLRRHFQTQVHINVKGEEEP